MVHRTWKRVHYLENGTLNQDNGTQNLGNGTQNQDNGHAELTGYT